MLFKLDEIFDRRLIANKINVSDLEFQSWEQQKTEALSYQNDNTVETPLLTTLASIRGISLQEMTQKVIDAINVYNTKISNLLAAKQNIENEIKNCQNIGDCHRILHNRFEISMSALQMSDENITYGAKFNI
jgi:hypothetical protein